MSWLRERPSTGPVIAARTATRRSLRNRALRLEFLEARTVMTALPFGATPDDTGEYMLGDVHVTVVLMESNGAIDNGTITYDASHPPTATINYTPENWTSGAIAAVKQNIEDGLNWWKDTLDALPTVRDGLLNFTFDWTRLNNPVQTAYEPIARRSNDVDGNGIAWINSFLTPALAQAGLPSTGSVSADIRKFNNYQRQQNDADWAFTIIVVNNAADLAENPAGEGEFATGGSFRKAFSFAGGRYMVVPASRPASTYAHEVGHMFWALDEYAGGGTSSSSRGYYNTPNSNAWDNPETGFEQQPSIMTNDVPNPTPPALPTSLLTQAYNTHVTSQSSSEMIGWRDTDGDGIFDVLDVPFELTGTGRFEATTGTYRFTGSTAVRTLPNLNPAFLQNDITINRIREVQYAIDDGPWQVVEAFPERTYKTTLDLQIIDPALAAAGSHTIKIRTIDTRTGAMSPEFVGTTGTPSSTTSPDAGTSGFVYFDSDGDGSWDRNEGPLVDWAIDLVDPFGTVLPLQRNVDPDDYSNGDILNNVRPEVTLSVQGGDASRNEVQELTLSGSVGATVTPSFGGVLGTALSFDLPLSPGQVLASLQSIPALTGNILVSFGNGFGKFNVTFIGGLATTDVPLIAQGASTGGGTLSAETKVDPIAPDVYAVTGPVASQKPLVFGNYSILTAGLTNQWTSSRQFRADFSTPVSSVSLKAMHGGTGTASVGRLEAYDAAGNLLERYTTRVLTGGGSETMHIALPTAQIKYIVAYGHMGTGIALDLLTWGPRASATTNTLGAWSLPSLLTGSYRVKVTPPLGHIVTTPQGGQYLVSYNEGQPVGNLNFGIYNTDNIWHNIALPENVNADPQFIVNAIDVLVVVNWLTINGVGNLPATGDPNVVGYVDVNNDKVCTASDVLALVNYVTLHPPGAAQGGGGGGGSGEGETGGGAGLAGGNGGGPGGEGEETSGIGGDGFVLQLSLEYLASVEDVHLHLDGDGHGHEEDDDHEELFQHLGNSSDGLADDGVSSELDDIVNGWLDVEPIGAASESPVASEDASALASASPVGQLIAVPLAEVAESIVPLARRKRLDRAIDVLAEDLTAAKSPSERMVARLPRR
jgi:hypothetical protein